MVCRSILSSLIRAQFFDLSSSSSSPRAEGPQTDLSSSSSSPRAEGPQTPTSRSISVPVPRVATSGSNVKCAQPPPPSRCRRRREACARQGTSYVDINGEVRKHTSRSETRLLQRRLLIERPRILAMSLTSRIALSSPHDERRPVLSAACARDPMGAPPDRARRGGRSRVGRRDRPELRL